MKTPFPKTGQYFGMRNKTHQDHSFHDAIFVCLASDTNKVVYKVVAESYSIDNGRVHFSDRTQWYFAPVSRAVIKIAKGLKS
jgi:DNA-binding cell septation regulator SpoVG